MIGFGGAFTDASCYLLRQMPPEAQHALLSDLYGPNGLRLSVGRTCIGASDYSTKFYTYDDTSEPDPELKQFNIEHDRAWIVPTLRAARELNPDLYLFSCVWSPPGWMKTGGSVLGGSMREHWFSPLMPPRGSRFRRSPSTTKWTRTRTDIFQPRCGGRGMRSASW